MQEIDKAGVEYTRKGKALFATVSTLGAIFAGLCLNFTYEVIKTFSTPVKQELLYTYILSAVIFGCLFWSLTYFFGIPAIRKAFLDSSAKIWKQDDAPKCKVIINALSLLRDDVHITKALEKARTLQTDKAKKDFLTELCDPEGEYKGWSWQQPMRLLKHNFDELEVLYTMLTEKSGKRYDNFQELISLLVNSDRKLELKSKNINEEEYTQVYKDIASAIRECCKIKNVSLNDMCIDITSGTREYSAAATVITLNSDALFSYVQTTGTDEVGQVVIYNASVT